MPKAKQPEGWTPSFPNRRDRRPRFPAVAEVVPLEVDDTEATQPAPLTPPESTPAKGDVLMVDERTGRPLIVTSDKSTSGLVHTSFASTDGLECIESILR